MNRYVVLREEEYDCHTVDFPHPVVSALTRDELLAGLEAAWLAVEPSDSPGLVGERGWGRTFGVELPLGDTGLTFSPRVVQAITGDRPPYVYRFRPPTVLTVDEWFEREGQG